VKRSRELREYSSTARVLIFTRSILEFYFDFFMQRAVLFLPALLCAARKRKFARQIQTLRAGILKFDALILQFCKRG